MRTVQFLMLTMLIGGVARADLIFTGSASIFQIEPNQTLFQTNSSCQEFYTGTIFADCSVTVDYGFLAMSLTDSGDGCDNCFPKYGASNEATIGFTDSIIFYGPPGGTAAVAWYFQNFLGATMEAGGELPSVVTFDVPYEISVMVTGFEIVAGDDTNFDSGSWALTGFQLYSQIPGCDPNFPESCGPPLNVSIATESGFLYGGHTPEPSSIIMLGSVLLLFLAYSLQVRTRQRKRH